MVFRQGRTPTGKLELVSHGACAWDDFPGRAQSIVNHLSMTIVQKIDGADVRMWLVRIGVAEFCISCDTWLSELSVTTWGDTPESALESLNAADRRPER